jgi:hypothetical protein
MNMVRAPHPLLDDDACISEELIGRLHHALESSVLDLVASFGANKRASLAMHCYRKCHLRRIGLAIAATCDLNSLVQEWGSLLGRSIFAQSRGGFEDPSQLDVGPRRKITLARSAGGDHPPLIDVDDVPHSSRSASTAELLEAA